MADKDKKGFAISEEKEHVLFPPPFTLLNNKTKANAVSMLSTLRAPNYSFSVHFFTEWIQRCEPISHAQRVLIWITNQAGWRKSQDSKHTCEKRNIWTTFSKSEKHFSFQVHGKRYLYKSYMEQNTVIQR